MFHESPTTHPHPQKTPPTPFNGNGGVDLGVGVSCRALLGPLFLVGPSTILPDVSTITIPSYLLGSFYYFIYFYPFFIMIDPQSQKSIK